MRPALVRAAAILVVLLAAGRQSAAQGPAPAAARPVDPIRAIVDAFRSTPLVALGEDHGNEQGAAFRLALLRDPAFLATVDDIVVEFGNARYQSLVDRFVMGEPVDDAALRRVWQDTTAISGVWDRPIYEAFFRAVRDSNATRPRARPLRVLLADLPVDWEAAARTPPAPGQRRLYGQPVPDDAPEGAFDRDRHAAGVVERETLAKGRRALIVFGDGHLSRRPASIVGRLERDGRVRIFTIASVARRYDSLARDQPDVATWPIPSLALVGGTALGAGAFSDVDAVLYLGSPASMTTSRLAPSLCQDATYVAMRRDRSALAGMPPAQADALLARDCPAIAPR
jgi:hypothetical protein